MFKAPLALTIATLAVLLLGGCAGSGRLFSSKQPSSGPALPVEETESKTDGELDDSMPEKIDAMRRDLEQVEDPQKREFLQRMISAYELLHKQQKSAETPDDREATDSKGTKSRDDDRPPQDVLDRDTTKRLYNGDPAVVRPDDRAANLRELPPLAGRDRTSALPVSAQFLDDPAVRYESPLPGRSDPLGSAHVLKPANPRSDDVGSARRTGFSKTKFRSPFTDDRQADRSTDSGTAEGNSATGEYDSSADKSDSVEPEKQFKQAAPDAWKKELSETIKAVQLRLKDTDLDDSERTELETVLRLLYVPAQRREEALKPIEQRGKDEQAFWSELIFAVTETLNTNGMPLADRRATSALRHLRKAADHLAVSSSLDVRSLTFCTSINGYGRYQEFPENEFKAGREVLLYVEVDNFAVQENSKGYETVLNGTYQIFDMQGVRVADHTFSAVKDICQNRRRDFFIPYRIYLPNKIAPGKYRLVLSIEDEKAKKFGQGSITFTIKRGSRQ